MSHRKDRERAEKGLLFRDGKLLPKEDVPGHEPTATPEEVSAMIEHALRFAVIPKAGR